MARKRMFSLSVIDDDDFMEMELSAQALYFHLNMRADDDGFVSNARSVQKMIGASDNDLESLIERQFIIPFESGVYVIRHWRVHNTLSANRYHETEFREEKKMLFVTPNKTYSLEDGVKPDDGRLAESSKRQVGNLSKTSKDEKKTNISKKKESEDKKKPFTLAGKRFYEDENLNTAFVDYLEMRKGMNKAIKTERALKLVMNELQKLSSRNGLMDTELAIKVLEQSIMKSWQGLFPLKDNAARNVYDEWGNA